MRTTIDIDEDVLLKMKQIATQRGTTLGAAVSEYLRRALRTRPEEAERRNGVPLIQPLPGAKLPSLALVNQLRDGEDEE
jgi:hypothetical protein